jgi:hypothetical protein
MSRPTAKPMIVSLLMMNSVGHKLSRQASPARATANTTP